jgi:hypothetical protein
VWVNEESTERERTEEAAALDGEEKREREREGESEISFGKEACH